MRGMELPQTGHDPVQLAEVLHHLAPAPGQTIVDCTTGRGGHALSIAQRLALTGTLICLDADPRNLQYARQRLSSATCTVRFFHANFAELDAVLRETGTPQVDGILADLGISTNQLFEEQYGLSFAQSMPLDMRLDPRLKRTAADLVNHLPERELADILFQLAQERYSFRIARKIGEARRSGPITTTGELADLVRQAIPSRGGAPERIDPATRTFMALRMAVNDELGNLKSLLATAPRALNPGGRLVVISFHSMEDRLVKQAFRSAEQAGILNLLTKKPLTPADEEIERNPRSRSAKLRAAEKVTHSS